MKFENIEAEIDNILDLDGQELTPEQQAAVDAYLDELSLQEADAVDGLCRYMRLKAASAKAKREEARRLMASADSEENSVNYLKMRMMQSMSRRGLTKVKGSAYKASMRGSEYVFVTDEKALPAEYIRTKTTTEPDKLALKDQLKEGKAIPGAYLATRFSLIIS